MYNFHDFDITYSRHLFQFVSSRDTTFRKWMTFYLIILDSSTRQRLIMYVIYTFDLLLKYQRVGRCHCNKGITSFSWKSIFMESLLLVIMLKLNNIINKKYINVSSNRSYAPPSWTVYYFDDLMVSLPHTVLF